MATLAGAKSEPGPPAWRAWRELPVPETADALIIGVCLDYGMPLLTTSPRHFTGTPRLRVLGLDDVRPRPN